MIYSHTQIAQYLRCPRSYRHRYLDGWREKETRAAMVFGRCFEQALAAYFTEKDCTAALFKEWGAFRDAPFEYKKGDSWDRLVHQGVHLLERFAQDDRVRIENPESDLQVKLARKLPGNNEFVAYIDALGELDGRRCLIDWKTTASRYPEKPDGLLALDPQLICYSWISGIPDVALAVFVRKNRPEIQYLQAAIFGRTAAGVRSPGRNDHWPDRIRANSSAPWHPLPAERMLRAALTWACALKIRALIRAKLIRRPGASDLDWLDELVD